MVLHVLLFFGSLLGIVHVCSCNLELPSLPSSSSSSISWLLKYHYRWRQRGRVVSGSDHYLDLFHGRPEFKSSVALINSQLVCLQPVGILNNVMLNLNHLFSC